MIGFLMLAMLGQAAKPMVEFETFTKWEEPYVVMVGHECLSPLTLVKVGDRGGKPWQYAHCQDHRFIRVRLEPQREWILIDRASGDIKHCEGSISMDETCKPRKEPKP